MRLYHFCSKNHIDAILSEGLTEGRIPIPDFFLNKIKGFVEDCQWLTSNRDFSQSWEEYSSLPYRRNDYRIEVKIPKDHRQQLHKWDEICESTIELRRAAKVLNEYGDPENWHVFMGRVKPSWFRTIKTHPKRDLQL